MNKIAIIGTGSAIPFIVITALNLLAAHALLKNVQE